MRLRGCPPMLVKKPPAKILPSACTAMAKTVLLAFGSNESAKPVVASSRAMLLRVCPPMLFAREIAARQNLAVRLHRDGIDNIVRVRVEGGVERAVRVQPGNVVARDRRSTVGRERCKIAADKDLAVRLHDDDANRAVRVRIETGVRPSSDKSIAH